MRERIEGREREEGILKGGRESVGRMEKSGEEGKEKKRKIKIKIKKIFY